MTTSSSPLEAAILALNGTGWYLHALSHGPFKTQRPWLCQLSADLFGSHFQGTKIKDGGYTVYRNSMTLIIGDGETALEAVNMARKALDNSYLKGVYQDLERAFMENLNALQARNSR